LSAAPVGLDVRSHRSPGAGWANTSPAKRPRPSSDAGANSSAGANAIIIPGDANPSPATARLRALAPADARHLTTLVLLASLDDAAVRKHCDDIAADNCGLVPLLTDVNTASTLLRQEVRSTRRMLDTLAAQPDGGMASCRNEACNGNLGERRC